MRAARFNVSRREFGIQNIPVPEPSRGQVRLKVMAAGLCLSDIHLLSGILTPGFLESDEVTMGHEIAGVIDKLGQEVSDWTVGDRAIVCAGVRDSQDRVTTLGFDYDGGFAEYVVIDSATLVRIPPQLSFDHACIIPDAVSTPWAAVTQTAKVKKGESAAVFGIGGLGVHAVQLLKLIGAFPLFAIDPLAQARERALSAGADFALDPSHPDFTSLVRDATQGKGLDVAFDFAGSSAARSQGLRLLSEGGRLVIVGLTNEQIIIPNDITFAYKRNQILGHYGSEPIHTRELVSLVASKQLDLSDSISKVFSLDEIKVAFFELENKVANPIRIVIHPH